MLKNNTISEEAEVLKSLGESIKSDYRLYHRLTNTTIETFKAFGFSENVLFYMFSNLEI